MHNSPIIVEDLDFIWYKFIAMNIKLNRKKYLFFIVLLLVSIGIISGISCMFAQSMEDNDLYPILNDSNQLLYINENGEIIVKFKPSEFDYWGNFSEGKVFLVKKIKRLYGEGVFEYILAKLYIMDNKGKIIKKIPYDSIVGINEDLGEHDIPEFYNNKAIIKLKHNNILIVNNAGDVVLKSKKINFAENRPNINIDYINANKEMTNNWFSPNTKYKMDENGPFPFHIDKGINGCNCLLGCINYKNKNGKIVINLNTCDPGGSGDITRDPYFYNGVAMVFGDIPDPTRRFINNKGEYINNETYLTATPFWKELAGVVKLNEDFRYINVNGEEIKIIKE